MLQLHSYLILGVSGNVFRLAFTLSKFLQNIVDRDKTFKLTPESEILLFLIFIFLERSKIQTGPHLEKIRHFEIGD